MTESIDWNDGEDDDEAVHTSSFWADLNRNMANPRFRRSYEEQTRRLTQPDDYEPADTPARPSAGRTGRFWARFWRSGPT